MPDFLGMLEKSVSFYYKSMPRRKPSMEKMQNIRLIAHRGAHNTERPENTLAAFTAALDAGCHGIELDVHLTRDGVPVVNHDPDLNRIWGMNHRLAEIDFKELRQAVPDIPSLEEVVRMYGQKMHLYIEVKAPFLRQDRLAETLQGLKPELDYHIISLNENLLASLDRFPLRSRLLVAAHNNTARFCRLSLQMNYGGVLGHYLLLGRSHIRALEQAGQVTGVGFVDSKNSLYREVNRGLTLMFSDNIAALM